MRELNKKECAQVAGGSFGAIAWWAGKVVAKGMVGAVLGASAGPAGMLAGFVIGAGMSGAINTVYDTANEGRDERRIENYEY
jgi:hypothetical protein